MCSSLYADIVYLLTWVWHYVCWHPIPFPRSSSLNNFFLLFSLGRTSPPPAAPSIPPPSTPQWTCKPLDFFNDWTVELNFSVPAHLDEDNNSIIRFKDTKEGHQKMTILLKSNQKIVDFDKGCVNGYTIVWQEKYARES